MKDDSKKNKEDNEFVPIFIGPDVKQVFGLALLDAWHYGAAY